MLKPALITCLAAACALAAAQTGAEDVLRNATSARTPSPDKAVNPEQALGAKLRDFALKNKDLTPATAAQRWLDLAHALQALPQTDRGPFSGFDNSLSRDLIAALPPPDSWPIISAKLAQGSAPSDRVLLALTDELLGNESECTTTLLQLQSALAAGSYHQKAQLARILVLLAQAKDDKQLLIKELRAQVAAGGSADDSLGIDIPPLTAYMDEASALSLLKEILTTAHDEVVVKPGDPVSSLAAKVALENLDQLKVAQWGLVQTPEEGALYDVLKKRFGKTSGLVRRGIRDSAQAAQPHYFAYLIAHGRDAEAKELLASERMDFDIAETPEIEYLKKANKIDAAIDMLREVAKENTLMGDEYVRLAYDAGKDISAQSENQSPNDPNVLTRRGQYEQAAALLTERLAGKAPPSRDAPGWDASRLYALGKKYGRHDWVDLALAKGTAALAGTEDFFGYDWLPDAMIDSGRGPEAERLLADRIRKNGMRNREALELLAHLYYKVKRYEDVVALMENAEGWEHNDVKDLYLSGKATGSPALELAESLLNIGRTQDALRVTKYVIDGHLDEDAPFEVLLRFPPPTAHAVLDRLSQRHPLVPRPLIYKAELLRREGHLQDAERCVNRALQLDPQDATGSYQGVRFKVFSVYAAIEKALGRTSESDRFEKLFKASAALGTFKDWDPTVSEQQYVRHFVATLENDPADYYTRFELASSLARSEPKKAEAELDHAIGDLVQALKGGAVCPDIVDYATDNIQEAYRRCLARHSGVEANYLMGRLLFWRSDPRAGLELFTKALAQGCATPSVWSSLEQIARYVSLPVSLQQQVSEKTSSLWPVDYHRALFVKDCRGLWATVEPALTPPLTSDPIFDLRASRLAMAASQNYGLQTPSMPHVPGTQMESDIVVDELIPLLTFTRGSHP